MSRPINIRPRIITPRTETLSVYNIPSISTTNIPIVESSPIKNQTQEETGFDYDIFKIPEDEEIQEELVTDIPLPIPRINRIRQPFSYNELNSLTTEFDPFIESNIPITKCTLKDVNYWNQLSGLITNEYNLEDEAIEFQNCPCNTIFENGNWIDNETMKPYDYTYLRVGRNNKNQVVCVDTNSINEYQKRYNPNFPNDIEEVINRLGNLTEKAIKWNTLCINYINSYNTIVLESKELINNINNPYILLTNANYIYNKLNLLFSNTINLFEEFDFESGNLKVINKLLKIQEPRYINVSDEYIYRDRNLMDTVSIPTFNINKESFITDYRLDRYKKTNFGTSNINILGQLIYKIQYNIDIYINRIKVDILKGDLSQSDRDIKEFLNVLNKEYNENVNIWRNWVNDLQEIPIQDTLKELGNEFLFVIRFNKNSDESNLILEPNFKSIQEQSIDDLMIPVANAIPAGIDYWPREFIRGYSIGESRGDFSKYITLNDFLDYEIDLTTSNGLKVPKIVFLEYMRLGYKNGILNKSDFIIAEFSRSIRPNGYIINDINDIIIDLLPEKLSKLVIEIFELQNFVLNDENITSIYYKPAFEKLSKLIKQLRIDIPTYLYLGKEIVEDE